MPLQRLVLGLSLILSASVAVVLTDRSGSRDGLPTISVVTYSRTQVFEDAYAGFVDEMKALGHEDGRSMRLVLRDAQMDIGTLNTIVATIAEERPDVVVPFTTMALQATIRRIDDRPVVFTLIASAKAAGAGESSTDHLANVTGNQVECDWDGMLRLMRATMPGVRKVGTLFAPGEANSVYFRDRWNTRLRQEGIELVSAPADRPTEIPEAADALVAQGVQAIVQIPDVSSSSGFASIVRSADRANLPVFGFSSANVRDGATAVMARDFRQTGVEGARLVDRVLKGEDPAKIPFTDTTKTVTVLNPDRLKRFGFVLPPAILQGATESREVRRP
jgi:ABC-type uncharacterized transport system substrate-binding protein